jgi:hypothetical protein
MFGSKVLEIAIGLALIYTVLSLVVSACGEIVAQLFKLRAQTLERGLLELLGSSQLVEKFYDHPLVASLYKGESRPSYIPSRMFALAVLDMIVPPKSRGPRTKEDLARAIEGISDQHIKNALLSVLDEASFEVEKFKEELQVWFNHSMDRVGGWYKRQSQTILLVVSTIVTVALNVDSIAIVQALSQDDVLRQTLASQAQTYVAKPPEQLLALSGAGAQNSTNVLTILTNQISALSTNIQTISAFGLPIGWKDSHRGRVYNTKGLCSWLVSFPWGGWLVTIFAISLGAPFWFDILNKIVTIRSSGKAPEEKPKSPKKEPKPNEPEPQSAKT